MFFVADDQFGVFEAHVLNDIDRKPAEYHEKQLTITLVCSDIGEWFESSIGSDFQSDALSIIDQASYLLEGTLMSTQFILYTTDKL